MTGARPNLTVPKLRAFGAFGRYALLALPASKPSAVSSRELEQVGMLTTFLIGAPPPPDALIRLARGLGLQTIGDPDAAALCAPAATLAQILG